MLLEVASMQTPIICSDIPENKSVFSGSEVLYFKAADSGDLAEKITWAIKHPGEMKRKAVKAKTRINNEYSWSKIAVQYSELYQRLLT